MAGLTRVAETAVELPDVAQPRPAGAARHAGRRVVFLETSFDTVNLGAPVSGTARIVDVALPGLTQVLQLSPLPFAIEPVLRRLPGLPTFYIGPFTAIEEDAFVPQGALLQAGATSAFVAVVFPDG